MLTLIWDLRYANVEINIACKEIRQKLNISQKELADMIGSNQTEVSLWKEVLYQTISGR